MGGWTAKPQLGLSNALGAPVCNFLEKPKDRTLKHAKRNPRGGSFLQLFRWLSLGVSRNIARPSGLYYRLSWAEVLLLYSLLEKMFVGLVPHTVWVPRTYTSHFYPVAAKSLPRVSQGLGFKSFPSRWPRTKRLPWMTRRQSWERSWWRLRFPNAEMSQCSWGYEYQRLTVFIGIFLDFKKVASMNYKPFKVCRFDPVNPGVSQKAIHWSDGSPRFWF